MKPLNSFRLFDRLNISDCHRLAAALALKEWKTLYLCESDRAVYLLDTEGKHQMLFVWPEGRPDLAYPGALWTLLGKRIREATADAEREEYLQDTFRDTMGEPVVRVLPVSEPEQIAVTAVSGESPSV